MQDANIIKLYSGVDFSKGSVTVTKVRLGV